jgi:hypothetical protein
MTPLTPVRKRPTRLNITFTPEGHAALERLAQTSGIAISQYVSRLVHDAVPLINATADALAIARKSPQQAAEIMKGAFDDVMAPALQVRLELGEVGRPDQSEPAPLRRRPRKRAP